MIKIIQLTTGEMLIADIDKDNVIEQKARTLGIDCYRGSETDVLDRYYRCAKQFEMKTIVRITADCPIIDPFLVEQLIN